MADKLGNNLALIWKPHVPTFTKIEVIHFFRAILRCNKNFNKDSETKILKILGW